MKRNHLFLLIAVFAVFLLTNAVAAALDLGVDELTLDPGEFYEFTPQEGTVYWFVSDESVLELGGSEGIGVRALEPGTAVVFAMTDDYLETDSCVVTVTGEAKAVKAGNLYYQDLTEEDLAKINDPALAVVLGLASDTAAFPMGIGDLSGHDYKVLIVVKEGSQQKVADAAEAMGLVGTWAYKYVPMAALCGDANDIAKLLIDYRDDIVSVETDEKYTLNSDDEAAASDGITGLSENAEKLSNIKAMHDLDFTGADQYVAILDTGVKSDHEQFIDESTGKSRVVYEHCYSSAAADHWVTTIKKNGKEISVYERISPVCEGTTTEAASGEPSGAKYPSYFNHGTHVAGIAAGKDGVAPDAKIIAVQIFTEFLYYELDANKKPTDTIVASESLMYSSDETKALEYILDLIEEQDINVASVNMSYGGGKYSSYVKCYNDDLYSKLLQKGTISCAASGNNSYDGFVSSPAASSYTFTVGALANQDTPAVVSYSNHSKLVNILAPGTGIKSGIYTDTDSSNTVTPETNGYATWQGTSMATPMVSGAFALLRQMYPDYTAEELENFMLDITEKSAARAGVTKPVLNFDHIAQYYITEPDISDYTVTGGNRTITVSVSANAAYGTENSDYDGCKVALYNSAGKLVSSKFISVQNAGSVLFTGLTNDAVYNVKVWGYKEINGTKYLSNCITRTPMVPMAAPTGLTLTLVSADSLSAAWTNHLNDTITVEYSDSQSGTYKTGCTGKGNGGCVIRGLNPNKTYYFRFKRYNTISESYSPWSAAYTYYLPAVPAASDYEVSNGNRTISVKLNPKTDSYTGYKIEIVNPDTSKVVSTRTVAVTKAVTYTFSGLTNNKVYNVRVYGYKTVNRVNYFSAAASTQMAPMAVPTGLDLTINDGTNTVTAVWTGHESDQISVEYAADGGAYSEYCNGTGTCTGTIALEQNKVYSFRFRWYNKACESYSPYSAVINKLLLAKPVKDTDFTVGNGNRIITVGLKASGVYTGYKVEIVLVSTGKTVSTKTVAVTKDTTYSFSGLTNNAVYNVKVSGYKTVNRVNYFSDAVTTPMVPMTVPTGLVLTVKDDDTVLAAWPDNTDKTIKVEYKAETDTSYTEYCTGTGSCDGKALAKNTVYYFRFSWFNIDCKLYSPVSAEQSKMLVEKPQVEADKTQVGYKKIRVYFDDVESLTGHQIKTYIVSTGKLVSTVNVKRTANLTYADITRLTNDVEYKFEIYAYRTVGRTTYYSEPVTVTATPKLKPVEDDKPANVTASGGGQKITVSWDKDTWTGGHYIELYRTDNYVMAANAYVANNAATYTFSGSKIDNDIPYLIRVWKYNEKSPKAVGNSYEQTTAISLAAPGFFAAAAGDGSITASWTYSGVAQNVKVYISTASGSGYTEACTVAADSKTCTISGLTNGTLYYVKAAAVYSVEGQADLTGTYTAVKSVMPLPASTSAKVAPGSKQVTVEYDKDSTVTGHIIQLYKMSGSTAQLVKTATNVDKTNPVKVSFTGLANGTTYRVTICSYKTVGKTTYRGALATYDSIVPSADASASKELIGVSGLGEDFDGFVDPVDELNAQADAEVKEEQQPSIFDLFRL